jgi:GAF domain-containing protein
MSWDGRGRLRRLAGVVQAANGPEPAGGLCRAGAEALSVSGASLMVMVDDAPLPLAWSGPVAARLEELQSTLGEGPCVDAHHTGRSVSEPNLIRPRRTRWVALGPAAVDAGAAALFSFPLRLGGVRLGAFTLYQTSAGDLSVQQHADAQAVADIAMLSILNSQAHAPGDSLSPDLERLAYNGAEVHQASGMVSVQLGVGVGEALVRLRAHAFAESRPLADVAVDVVARRLRFEE